MGTQDVYRLSMLRPEDGVIVVQASGEIDVVGSYAFREQLLALLDEEPARLAVDLNSLTYVDTYALSALVDLARRCRLEGRGLALVCSGGRMRSALASTGLDQYVPTHATVDEALGRDDAAS